MYIATITITGVGETADEAKADASNLITDYVNNTIPGQETLSRMRIAVVDVSKDRGQVRLSS